MHIYNKQFSSEREKEEFVRECDEQFRKKISDIADEIASDKNISFVLLSGPSCSGKTSSTQFLKKYLKEDGCDVYTVSIDDFYKNASEQIDSEGNRDFESIKSIDFNYLAECVKSLYEDRQTVLPIYNFKKGKRDGLKTITPSKDAVVIFEGIQAHYPEITALFTPETSKKALICVKEDLIAYDKFFTPFELRLSRRLIRDYLFRGASAELTFTMWPDVIENEEENIYPYVKYADIIVDSFVPYEMNVKGKYLKYVLKDITADSPFYAQAKEMLEKYEGIPEIDSKYVLEDSFFREFIGTGEIK